MRGPDNRLRAGLRQVLTDLQQAAAFIRKHRVGGGLKRHERWSAASVQREVRRCWPYVTLVAAYRALDARRAHHDTLARARPYGADK